MSDRIELQGACLCGMVRVSVKTASTSVGACHCNMCRKWTGGPLMVIECDDDVVFEGEEHVAVFSSSDWAERGFCARCGSHLFYRLKEGGLYAVPVGLFDDDESFVFDHQVFIDEKPAFYAFANETRNLTGAELFARHGASQPSQE